MGMDFVEPVRAYVRKVIRYLAVGLNKLFRGRLSPDMVTTTSWIMHIPIGILIGYGKLELAAVLLIIFGLFDVLDGELARLQKTASERGMLYDASTDRVKEVILYSGVAFWLSATEYSSWTFLAVIACGASITVSYVKAKGEAAIAVKNKSIGHHELNRMFKEGVVSFEARIFILILGLIFNQLLVTTALIAVLSSYTVFERLVIIGRKL